MSDHFIGPASGSTHRPAANPPPPGTSGPSDLGGWGPLPDGANARLLPRPSPNRGRNVKVVVACVVGSLFVLGALAAIAVPTFLSQKENAMDAYAATSISVPKEMLGQPRLTDAVSLQIIESLKSRYIAGAAVAAIYGPPGEPQIRVSIDHVDLNSYDQQTVMKAADDAAGAIQLPVVDVEPGRLGGALRCTLDGPTTHTTYTMCTFADAGAIGTIELFGPLKGEMQLVHQIREAVEHRD